MDRVEEFVRISLEFTRSLQQGSGRWSKDTHKLDRRGDTLLDQMTKEECTRTLQRMREEYP